MVGSGVVLRIVAHGRDRATALARLRHALSTCAVVVDELPPPTAPTLLAAVAARSPTGHGSLDASESDPLAVLVSAVRASDSQRETQRAAFHARAARGRPEPVDASGVSTSLNYDGQQYALTVFQTGPHTYRIDSGDAVAEVAIDRANDFEWTVTAAGRARHVVIASHGTGCLLEIDGIAHRVDRDEGIAVRAQWPALIVSVAVTPGQEVAEGDPLVVAEAMKMESTLRAPFAGTITSVEVLPNEQVDAGAPLVLIRPATRGDVESTVQPTNGATRQLRRDGPGRHLRASPVRAGVRRPARLPAGLRARPRRPLRAARRAALVRQPRQRRRHQAAGRRGRLPGPVHRPGPALAVRARGRRPVRPSRHHRPRVPAGLHPVAGPGPGRACPPRCADACPRSWPVTA